MHQLNDPWTQVINQFFDIDRPKISLHPKGKKWKIKIASADPQIFYWAKSVLSKWHNVIVNQEKWNIDYYEFENRREAEKFITLFNLSWEQ